MKKAIEPLTGKSRARIALEKRAARAGLSLPAILKETKGDEAEADRLITLIITTQ